MLRWVAALLFLSVSSNAFADLGSASCDQPATEMRVYIWQIRGFAYDCGGCFVKQGQKTIAINKIQIVDRQADGAPNTIQIVDPANLGFHFVYDADFDVSSRD